jgi:hypothetical protein
MKLKHCINNLTHSLLQDGEEMRQRGVEAPPSATKNLDSSCSGEGRSIQSDSTRPAFLSPGAHGTGAVHGATPCSSPSAVCPRAIYKQQLAFKRRKKIQPDRVQPMPCIVRGTSDVSGSGVRCMYKKCPGLNIKSKRKVS